MVSAAPAVVGRGGPAPSRTRLLLEGAIVPTMLRLAPANIVINVLSIAVNTTVDSYFVGRLEYVQIPLVFGLGAGVLTMAARTSAPDGPSGPSASRGSRAGCWRR